MNLQEPALYVGTIRHRRRQPRVHEFTYRVFQAWLDVDRIPESMAQTAWTAHNRFHWASFHDADYLGGTREPLRDQLAASARAEGLRLPDGPVFLLTNLRYLGYCFNPISLFYCYGARDQAMQTRPEMILAEVTSTFGERRHYWLHAGNAREAGNSMRYACGKALHVSPFMPMELDYNFTLNVPGEQLVAHIGVKNAEGEFLDATWNLQRRPWNSGALGGQLVRHPWMTVQVMAAIHWEAARLWWKGVPVHTHPARLQKEAAEKGATRV